VFLVIQLVLSTRVFASLSLCCSHGNQSAKSEVQIEAVDGSNKLHWS